MHALSTDLASRENFPRRFGGKLLAVVKRNRLLLCVTRYLAVEQSFPQRALVCLVNSVLSCTICVSENESRLLNRQMEGSYSLS